MDRYVVKENKWTDMQLKKIQDRNVIKEKMGKTPFT